MSLKAGQFHAAPAPVVRAQCAHGGEKGTSFTPPCAELWHEIRRSRPDQTESVNHPLRWRLARAGKTTGGVPFLRDGHPQGPRLHIRFGKRTPVRFRSAHHNVKSQPYRLGFFCPERQRGRGFGPWRRERHRCDPPHSPRPGPLCFQQRRGEDGVLVEYPGLLLVDRLVVIRVAPRS